MQTEQMPPSLIEALDLLLDQLDPREHTIDAVTREARRLCGLWLALRRVQLDLTVEMVAQRMNVEPNLLFLIETGFAEPSLVPDSAWYRLCLVLEGQQRDLKWVATVLYTALGHIDEAITQIMEQVSTELADALLETERDPATVSVTAQQAIDPTPLPHTRIAELLAGLSTEKLHLLTALKEHAGGEYELKRILAGRIGAPQLGLMTIREHLEPMVAANLVEEFPSSYGLTSWGTEMATKADLLLQAKAEAERARTLAEQAAKEAKEREQQMQELVKQLRPIFSLPN